MTSAYPGNTSLALLRDLELALLLQQENQGQQVTQCHEALPPCSEIMELQPGPGPIAKCFPKNKLKNKTMSCPLNPRRGSLCSSEGRPLHPGRRGDVIAEQLQGPNSCPGRPVAHCETSQIQQCVSFSGHGGFSISTRGLN